MTAGVYKIVNRVNGSFYLGSSKHCEKRLRDHRNSLNRGDHHNVVLQRAWEKYGADVFDFVIVLKTQRFLQAEARMLKTLSPRYNIGRDACGGDNLTLNPRRDEIIKQMTLSIIKRMSDPAERERRRVASRGKNNSNWKGGVSIKKCKCGKRINVNNERCMSCRDVSGSKNPFFGKAHSVESRRLNALKHLGNKPSNERPVIIEEKRFRSVTDAARRLHVCPATVIFRIKSRHWDYKYEQNFLVQTHEKRKDGDKRKWQ